MDLPSASIAIIALSVVLSMASVLPPAASQSGFSSFDCGLSSTAYFDNSTGIMWETDGHHWPSIYDWSVATTVTPPDSFGYLTPLSTMRYFPLSSNSSSSSFDHIGQETKFCYELPAVEDSFYLLRATFWLGSGLPDGYPAPRTAGTVSFRVIVDTYVGVQIKIPVPQTSVWFEEMYVKAVGSTVTLCLSAASDSSDTPFLNAIEIRLLTNTMVTTQMVNGTNKALRLFDRQDLGAPSSSPPFLRYPDDVFDRFWFPATAENVNSTNQSVVTSGYNDHPPSKMLQTCYVGRSEEGAISVVYNASATESTGSKGVTVSGTHYYFVNMWFAELDSRVNASGSRVFSVNTDGDLFSSGVDVFNRTGGKLNTPYGIYTPSPWGPYTDYFNISAVPEASSLYPPTMAGVEILQLLDDPIANATHSDDVMAIKDLIVGLSGFNFSGDPCLPSNYSYTWIDCSTDTPRVTSISLSNYNTALGKTIPISLNDLHYLTTILLDGNALEGSIPSFSNLLKLQVLNLSNNNLNGSIPSSLADLPQLTYLDLRNNNLNGTIPAPLIDKQKNGLTLKYEGNPFLCNGTCEPSKSSTGKSHTTLIIGIIVGLVVSFVLVLVTVLCICRCMRKQSNSQGGMVESAPKEKYPADPRVLRETQIMELERINAHAFSFQEIMDATNNFSTVIGKGGFGSVYRGTLENGLEVAIKVLSDASHQGEREFLNEVALLSRIHHDKLVALVGYCIEKKLILIYEYMSNGSLFDALFRNEGPISLNWMDRLCILLDAAQGLAYLHHGYSSLIIHRDVKSSNILMNENLEGKISDFGISRLKANDGNAMTTTLMGSLGYIDPEFALTFKLSEKVDVYSFGVVILETLCGRTPVMKDPNMEAGDIQLVKWVRSSYETFGIEEVLDNRLGGYNVESVRKVIELATACVQFHGERRPTMNEVYNELLEASRLECNSFPNSITDDGHRNFMGSGASSPLLHVHAR